MMRVIKAIGIGTPLTERPSHTTQRTGPYYAVRLIRQNQIQSRGTQVQVIITRLPYRLFLIQRHNHQHNEQGMLHAYRASHVVPLKD